MADQILKAYAYVAIFLVTSILILIAGDYALEIREYIQHVGKIDSRFLPIDRRAYDAAYSDIDDKEELFGYFMTTRSHFEPYIHWRSGPITSKYINVDESGMRRTIKSPNAQAKKVYVMGGSTVWGTGVPDGMTIPSFLQELLGSEYDVYNFGDSGYVSTQELNQLLKILADGEIPDIVIFYDGNNDAYAGAYSPAIPRDPQNIRRDVEAQDRARRDVLYRVVHDWFEPTNYFKLLWRVKESRVRRWDESIAGSEKERARRVVSYYSAHIRQVSALSREYGFRTLFFWQPNIFNPLRKQVSYEKSILEDASKALRMSQETVYYEAKKAFAGKEKKGIIFLGDMFNEVPQPVYLDWSHTTAAGNKLVAQQMYLSIKEAVTADVRDKVSTIDPKGLK